LNDLSNLFEVEILITEPVSFLLVQVVTRPSRSLTLDLVYREDPTIPGNPRRCGQLIVHAEECISSKTTTEMILKCSNLEQKDLFSRSVWANLISCSFVRLFTSNINNGFVLYLQDPFLLISKIVEAGLPIPVCKTEVLKNDNHPIWKPVFLSIQQVGSKVTASSLSCPSFFSP